MENRLTFKQKTIEVEKQLKETLIEKNKLYGDAALNPKRIISGASPSSGIAIRLDDKINRLLNSPVDKETKEKTLRKNDVFDIMGYCILFIVSKMRELSTQEKKQSFKKEIDVAIVHLSTPRFDTTDSLQRLTLRMHMQSEKHIDSTKVFFDCLMDIISTVEDNKENVLNSVCDLFVLCLYIAVNYNYVDFKDQID